MTEPEEASLTIGELAARAGLNASALRYYERVGLLEPAERISGQRRYEASALDRLHTIAAAKQAGFSLDEVRRLLAGAADGRAAEELRELAERKLPEIEDLIGRAERMRAWLELARECRCGSLDVCVLFGESADASAELRALRAGTPA